jgi:hypothetical protein
VTKQPAVPSTPRVLARFNDYSGLLSAMRDRADERGYAISGETSHAVAGLSDRRLSQIMSVKTVRPGRNVRRIGIGSLGPVLGFLGCELWLVEDPAAMKLYDKRLEKRQEIKVQRTIIHHFQKVKTLREMGRAGGKMKFKNLHAKRALASYQRRTALMRWGAIKAAAKG